MATNGGYQVYISRWIPAAGQVSAHWEDWQEMEDTFPGLKYKLCEGLENQGEPKSYSEDYAETSVPRVHLTNVVKTNRITLELVFIDVPGTASSDPVSRFAAYGNFLSFITGYRFKYKDSKRNIIRDMYLSGETEVSETAFYGGRAYIIVRFPCTSMNAQSLT